MISKAIKRLEKSSKCVRPGGAFHVKQGQILITLKNEGEQIWLFIVIYQLTYLKCFPFI